MRHKFYIVQTDGEITSEGIEDLKLFEGFRDGGVKKAILLGRETAIYYEAFERRFVMVGVDRNFAGIARVIARRLVFGKKKIDLSSLEEAFEFAKRVENADLDELARLR